MIDEYIKARKAGEKEYKARVAKGEYPFLPALDDILPDSRTPSLKPLGLMEIPVELIAGTKTRARQNSFAPDFMPLLEPDTEFAAKWSNLYQAQLEEGFTNAIKVYEYLHRFYVLEGNKRVSVSRFLEMPTILADVTRIMPDAETLKQTPVYAEFMEFYNVAPIYDIVCTLPGSYAEIAELLGRDLKEKWPDDMVKDLRAQYWRFSKVMNAMHDKKTEMPLGDAFLVYLRIYTHDALAAKPSKEIDKRLKKIRKELLTARNEENVALIENPDEALGAGGIISKTGNLLSKVIPIGGYTAKHPLKAAFIYDKDPAVSNWVYNHDAGRRRLEKAYGGIVATESFLTGDAGEKAGTRSFEDAVRKAVDWGADVVFTTSPLQMKDTLRAAIEYEDVIFLNCSINLAHQAVRTYYAKLYEAKFLAGVVAAIEADNHMIGYCSDYPIYGSIAAINAFAIGAAMVDPKARIYLEWSSRQNTDWMRTMQDKGIRVISAVDSTHPTDGSNIYGVFRIEDDGSIRHLAMPILKWGKLYEILVKTILEGNYHASPVDKQDKATSYWWGMISGVVDIVPGESLSPYTKQLVDILRSNIVWGQMNPFDGELHSQNGLVRGENDPPLVSRDIILMNWLNENIIGEIPDEEALTDEAKATVRVSGVK